MYLFAPYQGDSQMAQATQEPTYNDLLEFAQPYLKETIQAISEGMGYTTRNLFSQLPIEFKNPKEHIAERVLNLFISMLPSYLSEYGIDFGEIDNMELTLQNRGTDRAVIKFNYSKGVHGN